MTTHANLRKERLEETWSCTRADHRAALLVAGASGPRRQGERWTARPARVDRGVRERSTRASLDIQSSWNPWGHSPLPVPGSAQREMPGGTSPARRLGSLDCPLPGEPRPSRENPVLHCPVHHMHAPSTTCTGRNEHPSTIDAADLAEPGNTSTRHFRHVLDTFPEPSVPARREPIRRFFRRNTRRSALRCSW
jgi:hypothetical protein